MKKSERKLATGSLLAALMLSLAACGGSSDGSDGGSDSGSDNGSDAESSDAGTVVEVSLFEWGIEAPETAAAGSVTFEVTNDGGEIHELVIARADSTDGFVVDDTGKVSEDDFAEGDLIGEIEEFEAGTTESATFDLSPGTYVIFCNIVEEEDDGSHESHFQEGMVTTLVLE